MSSSLSLVIDCQTSSNGSIQIYYTNDEQKGFNEYDTFWKTFSTDKNELEFCKIGLDTKAIRIDIDNIDQLLINKLTVYWKKIPIKTYSSYDLYESIKEKHNVIINFENDRFFIQSSGQNANVVLNTYDYWSWFHEAVVLTIALGVCFFGVMFFMQKINDKVCAELSLISGAMLISMIAQDLIGNFYLIDNLQFKILNWLMLYVVAKLIYWITRSALISNCIVIIIGGTIGLINYYLILFRGHPLLPSDIYGLQTVLAVVDGYDFSLPDNTLVYVVVLFLFLVSCFLWKSVEFTKLSFAISTISLVFILSILCNTNCYNNLQVSLWNDDIVYFHKTQGSYITLLKYAEELRIKKPEGYSKNEVAELESSFIDNTLTDVDATQPQDIIMIMNESYSDLGKDIAATQDNWDDFCEGKISGNLYVSVRGGGTCNTEFESLTGHSMAFLPTGTYPFMSYIHEDMNSIVSYLREVGYTTTGIHLENETNWNRNNVYKCLGFDKFLSIDSFSNIEFVRERASDQFNYKKIIEVTNQNVDSKNFIFSVTSQNHGGYTSSENMNLTVDLTGENDYRTAEVYFSLMRLSDFAIKELITYYEQVEKPTMIIIYGDHQPMLGSNVDDWLLKREQSIGENLEKYRVPFLIWTNYEIEETFYDGISANYLPMLILKSANIELPSYYVFLENLMKMYPVITTQGILDNQGSFYESLEEVDSKKITDYKYLQYNKMFDS